MFGRHVKEHAYTILSDNLRACLEVPAGDRKPVLLYLGKVVLFDGEGGRGHLLSWLD